MKRDSLGIRTPLLFTLGLATLFAVATTLLGWWAVPAVAFAFGLTAPARMRVGLLAGLAAALAWGGLVVWTAMRGPVADVADTVGALVGLPGTVAYLITALFPGILAGCAGIVGSAIRELAGAAKPSGSQA